jgi:hypothetical protein
MIWIHVAISKIICILEHWVGGLLCVSVDVVRVRSAALPGSLSAPRFSFLLPALVVAGAFDCAGAQSGLHCSILRLAFTDSAPVKELSLR